MKPSDYTTSFLVNQTPELVLAAITNVRGWWSEEIEGSTNKLNDEFTYHYKDVHLCKMKIIAIIPNTKIVWQVLDNYFNFTQDKSEWKDTLISFEISKKGDKTEIKFTHVGLVPECECFTVCSESWDFYINHSLRNLITTGKGEPNHSNSVNLVDEARP